MLNTFDWGASTKDTKGRPLTGAVTYNLYRNGAVVARSNDLHEPDVVPDDSGKYAYELTAVCNGLESAKAAPIIIDSFVPAPPEVPQGFKVTVSVTVEPV